MTAQLRSIPASEIQPGDSIRFAGNDSVYFVLSVEPRHERLWLETRADYRGLFGSLNIAEVVEPHALVLVGFMSRWAKRRRGKARRRARFDARTPDTAWYLADCKTGIVADDDGVRCLR
jgi:hypothetical protein